MPEASASAHPRLSCPAYEKDPAVASVPNSSASTSVLAPADPEEQAKIDAAKNRPRRPGVSAEKVTVDKDWKPPFFEKSEEAIALLRQTFKENKDCQVMTGHLDEASMTKLIGAMFKKDVADGETLIKQGDPGDNFYVVDQGQFNIFVKRQDGTEGKVMEASRGKVFGQLALMYDAPRAATCIAAGECQVWALERDAFKQLLISAESTKKSRYEDFLEGVAFFDLLNSYERTQLSDALQPEAFDANCTIIKQGDLGNKFYLLEKGSALAVLDGEAGERQAATYAPGDYFGEVALLDDCPRQATVRAGPDGCEVLSVEKADFDWCLKPLVGRMREKFHAYPKYADILAHRVPAF